MTPRKSQGSSLDRRRFLRETWRGVGASLSLSLVPAQALFTTASIGVNPFTLGVASGDPTPDGIVLWTRLAPRPADPTSLGRRSIPVGWRVAMDSQMRRVAARGVAAAPAELAHSVHVEVDGLKPGRDYFYQFDVRGDESPVGHFRTAPAVHEDVRQLRFAFATCQDWPSGYYIAYRDMIEQDLDIVLHLGDYTYEYAIGESNGRQVPTPTGFGEETVDLRTYRLRHTLYKLDPDLQAAHAKFPFAVIWDDHEVQNDYSGLRPKADRRRRRLPLAVPLRTRRTTSTCLFGWPSRATPNPASAFIGSCNSASSRRSHCSTIASTARTTLAAMERTCAARKR